MYIHFFISWQILKDKNKYKGRPPKTKTDFYSIPLKLLWSIQPISLAWYIVFLACRISRLIVCPGRLIQNTHSIVSIYFPSKDHHHHHHLPHMGRTNKKQQQLFHRINRTTMKTKCNSVQISHHYYLANTQQGKYFLGKLFGYNSTSSFFFLFLGTEN